MPKPATEKASFTIVNDGVDITFTVKGSVVGAMVEAAEWLPAKRVATLIERLHKVHAKALQREADRAAKVQAREELAKTTPVPAAQEG